MVRVATDEDFLSFYGVEPPETWIGWTGLVYEEHGRLIGFGLVVWNAWGKATGYVDRKAPLSPFTMHRAAHRMFKALREVGEPALYVNCDPNIARAAYWLKRLGFKPMPDDPEIWQVTL